MKTSGSRKKVVASPTSPLRTSPKKVEQQPESVLDELRQQTLEVAKRITLIKEKLHGTETQIEECKRQKESYRKRMGGAFTAVQENDRHVNHQVHVMEERIQKAHTKYMRIVGRNEDKRKEIDTYRREKLVTQKERISLETDIQRLRRENVEYEHNIAWYKDQAASLEKQYEEQEIQSNNAQNHLANKFEELDGGEEMLRNPGAINEVLDGIEKAAEHAQSTKHIGALSHTQEQAIRRKTRANRWNIAALKLRSAHHEGRLKFYQELFDEVLKTLGMKDLDELVETASTLDRTNYGLLRYVNALEEEAQDLLVQLREKKLTQPKTARKERRDEGEARNMSLSRLEQQLRGADEKKQWFDEKTKEVSSTLESLRLGITKILGVLRRNDKNFENQTEPTVTDSELIPTMSMIEQHVAGLYSSALQSNGSKPGTPGVPQRSRGSTRSGLISYENFGAEKQGQGRSKSQVVMPKIGPHGKPFTLSGKMQIAAPNVTDDEEGGGRPLSMQQLRSSAMKLSASHSGGSGILPSATARTSPKLGTRSQTGSFDK